MFAKLREAILFRKHRKTTDLHQTPTLPQEIIDLIIDEVASQISSKALQPYSLISKAFHASCRRHLFSEIEISLDGLSHLRSQNLINVFKNPHNVDLISTVRSLRIVFPPPKYRSKWDIFRLSKWRRILYTRGRRGNSFLNVLNLLLQAPLTTFTLHARRGSPVNLWRTVDDRTMEAFRSFCTKPSLHFLRLSNLYFLDETLVTEAIRVNTLLGLSLDNVSLGWDDDVGRDNDELTHNPNLAPVISRIEKLDVRSLSSLELFRIFGRAQSVSRPFVALPRLHSFTFSAMCAEFEMQKIWAFIVESAGTLQTLEIEDLSWTGEVDHLHLRLPANKIVGIINLHQLTALRSLKIVAQTDSDLDLYLEKEAICHLLSPATPSLPLRIQSLTIEISMEMSIDSDPRGPCLIPPWLELDDLPMLGAFVDLHHLNLDYQLFYYSTEPQPPGNWKSEGDADRERILPDVYAHPSIEFQLNTRTICTPHCMQEYFRSQ